MTLEEKITHLRTTSMEEARAEGNAIIDSYRKALEKVLEDHCYDLFCYGDCKNYGIQWNDF